ncbi:MAG TPA: hypothetical protein VKB88_33260 [Bryobacteraceae bacterium]|nr:hypothetical protein [Bryobacteraceae bacterium]
MKPAWQEALLLGLCIAACSFQILIHPYIGLANNGDFAKVFARFAMAPPDGKASNFNYFVSDYRFDPKYRWKSEVQSSENVVAAIPILTAKSLGARVFNIRWLGALHMLLFLGAYYALLLYLRRYEPAFQLAIGGLSLWIFTDVAYVAYFNSFFSDAAALLGLLLMVPLALHLAAQVPPRAPIVWLFTAAALLFITSKTQHALWGIFPAAFLFWRRRLIAPIVLLAAAAYVVLSTSWIYPAYPLFTAIFTKVAPNAPSPQAAVREVGLGEPEYQFIGKQAYAPGLPTIDVGWLRYFTGKTSYGKLLRYWLRHPNEAGHVMCGDLANFAPNMRQLNLSNFRREDGHPPMQVTTHFATWSRLRDRLYRRWPFFIVGWYGLVIAAACIILVRDRSQRANTAICLGVAIMAVLEFVFASLTDANETDRHLLIFHALTEMTICFTAALSLTVALRFGILRRGPRDPARPA